MTEKHKIAAAYTTKQTQNCETVLVMLLQAFGSLKHTLRLVGGLVPRYLAPEQPPDIPPHVGTTVRQNLPASTTLQIRKSVLWYNVTSAAW